MPIATVNYHQNNQVRTTETTRVYKGIKLEIKNEAIKSQDKWEKLEREWQVNQVNSRVLKRLQN